MLANTPRVGVKRVVAMARLSSFSMGQLPDDQDWIYFTNKTKCDIATNKAGGLADVLLVQYFWRSLLLVFMTEQLVASTNRLEKRGSENFHYQGNCRFCRQVTYFIPDSGLALPKSVPNHMNWRSANATYCIMHERRSTEKSTASIECSHTIENIKTNTL